jgi:hypothetical protein
MKFFSIRSPLSALPLIVALTAAGCSDDVSTDAGKGSETGDGDGDPGDGDPGDGDPGDGDPGDGDPGDGDPGDGDPGDGDPGDGDPGDGDPGDGDPGDGDPGDGDPGDGDPGDGDPGDGDPGDGDPGGGLTEEDCLEDFSAEAWWSVALHDGPTGPVLPDEDAINFAALHICWLRITNPNLTGVMQYEAWEDDTLFVDLIPDAPTDDYEALKLEYDTIADEQPYMGLPTLHLLTFSQAFNIPALGLLFEALDEVNYSEANMFIGGEHDRYEYQDMGGGVWRWHVYDEFWDCFDGCDCARIWSYDIDHDAGTVSLVDYAEQGLPWCEF